MRSELLRDRLRSCFAVLARQTVPARRTAAATRTSHPGPPVIPWRKPSLTH
jgi:hypothetical protein